MNSVWMRGRDHAVQHFHRVVLHDAQVLEALFVDQLEQGTDPGRVDLDTEEIHLRSMAGDFRRGATHAEADLQHHRCGAAPDSLRIHRLVGPGQHITRAQFLQRTHLPRAHAAGPDHEAADRAVVDGGWFGRAGVGLGVRGQVGRGGLDEGRISDSHEQGVPRRVRSV